MITKFKWALVLLGASLSFGDGNTTRNGLYGTNTNGSGVLNYNTSGTVTLPNTTGTVLISGAGGVPFSDLPNIPNNSVLGNTAGISTSPSPLPMSAFPTASPTPSAVLALDQNSNALANEIIHGSAVVATSGTTDTLTVASAPIRIYTGSTAQTVQLPTTSTLKVGWQYLLESDTTGSGAISVVNAAASAICTIPVVTG